MTSLRACLGTIYRFPLFNYFNITGKRTVHNYVVMLPDFLLKRLASGSYEQYKLQENVPDDRNTYVTRVDEHSPIRLQIVKDILGDSSDTKTLMSSRERMEAPREGSIPEVVPFEQGTVRDCFQRLAAEKAMKITSRTKVLGKVFSIRREENETYPKAEDLRLLNYRASIVKNSCSWCTKGKYSSNFVNHRNLWGLLPTFISTIHRPEYNQQSVNPILMEARAVIKERITTRTIRAESPNGLHMIEREEDAAGILDDFVTTSIKEHYDLQRQEGQNTFTAESRPNQLVAALHPSESSPELVSIKQ